ncbi:homoserine dehydrogenase [Virgibacillus subterraneus]|uniref:Homoserine dehydrogenase n=1 Tax=Virgibacillus subterraneus TaxID=621109 RepID=A0A1H9A0Z2_9BACI|nr:homoserine dehydrogenase [Virgibacillus subterraneus]SEP70275.1 homoserine dehydrogenase [Virgibacillus subterraneus]
MKPINIALIGLGTVGCGVYQTLHIHRQRLEKLVGAPINISTIIIENPDKHQKISAKTNITTDVNTVLNNPEIDVVFEAIVGKEPAFSLLRRCIQAKKHVITSNKEMFAIHGQELKRLATQYNVQIGYDATTAGGIPIIQTIQQLLKANQIQYVQAILNGTTNFILSAMREKNITFSTALDEAQNWGYAEADPENDIEGFDAYYKLMILSDLIFEKQPDLKYVKRIGIRDITEDSLQGLQTEGKRVKHIAKIGYDATGNLTASVEPEAVSKEHPLYAVEGVNNAIHIKGDIVGDLTFTGPGAGSFPTASAMIEDFCILFKKEQAAIAGAPV